MANPTLKVEIAFADDPLDTTPTWTDVSAYVRNESVRIRRGRNDPWSPFTPGRLTVTLSNRDRRFDPKYTAGPYYGNLKPKRQIKVTATYSATDYVMFTGWTTAFPQDYRGAGKDAIVELTAYDALEWAAGVSMSSDPLYDYTQTLTGYASFLRQMSGTQWVEYNGNSGATRVGPEQSTGQSLAPGLKSTPVVFGGQTSYVHANTFVGGGGFTNEWAATFWMQTSNVNGKISDYYDSATGRRWTISLDSSGYLTYRDGTTTNYTSITATGVPLNDGLPHFVAITADSSYVVTIYIDGREVSYTTTTGGSGQSMSQYIAKYFGVSYLGTGVDPFNGTLQDFWAWTDEPFTDATVQTLYDLGRGFVEETADDRMTRVLDDSDWPASWRAISTGTRATVGPLTYNGQSLLTELRAIEASEQGKVFAAKDGNLTLLARYAHQEVTRNSTVQATFSDDGSDFKYTTMAWIEDDTNVRNDITVQTSTVQSRSQDSTSQTAYGRRSETVNTILSSYEQCRDMAAGLVYWWKDAAVRVEPFDVAALTSNNWATLLGLELGDKIQAEITPMLTGTQAVFPLLVDVIEWQIVTGKWQLRLAGSPVPPSFFVLGTSSLDGADVLGF